MAGKSVLIVDDNPINLKLMKILLDIEGYDVKMAVDAREVLAILETFQPELIMMDLQLPGMDGLALTEKLKADPRFKDIVIIAVTAYAMKGDEERALAAGCNGYLSKPINKETMPAYIQSFFDVEKGSSR
ncbi:MAG: response regulator [Legionellales bacterium]|nr:response regulator [Legionellales bacterium]